MFFFFSVVSETLAGDSNCFITDNIPCIPLSAKEYKYARLLADLFDKLRTRLWELVTARHDTGVLSQRAFFEACKNADSKWHSYLSEARAVAVVSDEHFQVLSQLELQAPVPRGLIQTALRTFFKIWLI